MAKRGAGVDDGTGLPRGLSRLAQLERRAVAMRFLRWCCGLLGVQRGERLMNGPVYRGYGIRHDPKDLRHAIFDMAQLPEEMVQVLALWSRRRNSLSAA